MPKRISKRVREEAAMLCATAASSNHIAGGVEHDFGAICDAHNIDCFAENGPADIARAAYWGIPKGETIELVRANLADALNGDLRREWWAEAESLLRCGWSPDDGGTPWP